MTLEKSRERFSDGERWPTIQRERVHGGKREILTEFLNRGEVMTYPVLLCVACE